MVVLISVLVHIEIHLYNNIVESEDMSASEDCTLFMQKVIDNGKKATYMMFGSDIKNDHHNEAFDFDESTLSKAIATLAVLAYTYCK